MNEYVLNICFLTTSSYLMPSDNDQVLKFVKFSLILSLNRTGRNILFLCTLCISYKRSSWEEVKTNAHYIIKI